MKANNLFCSSQKIHSGFRFLCQIKSSILLSFALAVISSIAGHAQAANNLVIAEIYGGGGNSSATYSNDFVVIFNPTESSVDVNGWSIQYASATGTTWSVAVLATESKMIPAGSYFLVRLQSGGAVGGSIGTPDASVTTINLAAANGKVALCNTTTALTGSCPTGGSIVDFLGYGTANCFEGTAAAAAPSGNTTSARRKNGGCTDTDSNSSDFETANPPTPRNSSSPTQNCNVTAPPMITSDPQSRTNNAGSTATFTVAATGAGLTYNWIKNGNSITEPNVLGISSSTLTITNVASANVGSYQVIVSNTVNSVTSQAAILTVNDPGINTQPVNRTNLIGDTANFFVGAGGLELTYQWRKDGTNIFDKTDAALDVVNVQLSNAGNYSVVVSNSLGNSITSSIVTLTVATTPSTRIARWVFNGNGKSLQTPAPSEMLNSASASLVGGTTATWAGGTFADPDQVLGAINEGWNSAGYPASTANNKTAGIQFNVGTDNYQNIFIAWEQRHSPTASKYTRVQYSTDGASFNDGPVITMETNNTFVFYTANLSAISGLNNNPNAAFRFVTEFESTATGSGTSGYVGSGGTYGTGGTIRYDIVSFYGEPLGTVAPIPLDASKNGNNIELTWSSPAFVLQSADEVNGIYSDVPGATSPYTTPVSGSRKFYRLVKP